MYKNLQALLDNKKELADENKELEKKIVEILEPFKIFFSKCQWSDHVYSLRSVARGRPILIKFDIKDKTILRMHKDISNVSMQLEMLVTRDVKEVEEMNEKLSQLAESLSWVS
jgi:uncharacterized protein with PhoU and TrkA domain